MRWNLALFAAAGALGCGSPTGFMGAASTYVLRTVAGDPLPAVYSTNEHRTVRVLADTLLLLIGGAGEHRVTRQVTSSLSGSTETTVRHVLELQWSRDGRRLELGYICPPNALCIAPPHLRGELTDGGLTVSYALGARVPQLFERIDH